MSEVILAVQYLLKDGDKCVNAVDAGLVQDWVKSNCVFALVEHSGEFGLFVLLNSKYPAISSDSLTIDKVFMINESFKCDVDSPSNGSFGDENMFVKITSNKQKFLFELPLNHRAKNVISDLSRACESFALKLGPTPDFEWLLRYQPSLKSSTFYLSDAKRDNDAGFEDSFADFNTGDGSSFVTHISDPSGDFYKEDDGSVSDFSNLPRQSIAMGVTPLAARESSVKLQMTMHEEQYTVYNNYTVFMGTWNVNGQSPKESLSDWLASDAEPCDFCVVGFQELDLSKEAFLFTDTPKEEEWLQAVKKSLHPKADYTMVKLIRLVGMMIIVFVKEELVQFVKNVAAETVGTGIMGKLGNKGGVAVRLDFYRTSICFVNCHLAAHMDECERRNQDYNDICSRIVFNQFKPPKFIKDHDHIYWMGDMNYRIMTYDTELVKYFIEENNFDKLLKADQLVIQQGLKKVFVGFNEGPINFLPTYKYDPGTNHWHTSEKIRPPAWCDRILWKGDNITQKAYRSHPTLLYSDHKPVSAVFESKAKLIHAAKYRKIYEEVMKKLDKLENEFLPQVSLDKLEVNFGTMHFYESSTQMITIANTGQIPVCFEFRKKLNDSKYCKEWLSVKPYAAFIKPGEKCDVELEVLVDKRIAHKLNSGKDKIYDILVLHLEGGKDLFITVNGSYEPSCFGSSLEALVRIPVPLSEVSLEKLIELENSSLSAFNDKLPNFEVPKEIWMLVNHLYRFGLTQKDLFQQPGLRIEVQRIRDKLDQGYCEFDSCSIHSAAEAFLLFIEALAEPVIPYEFYHKCLDCSNNFAVCKNVVAEIPKVHRNVFRYIIAFIRELLNHSSSNKLDAKMLATIFGSILLREPSGPIISSSSYRPSNQQAAERKKATFIFHFLMNDLED